MYFKGSKTQRGKDGKTRRVPSAGSLLQSLKTARAAPGGNQEPGNPFCCPLWVAGTQASEPSPTAFQDVQQQKAAF